MKTDYPVIDLHYHIYGWENDSGADFYTTTREYCTRGGFRAININALPSGTRDVSNNILAALYKHAHPRTYIHGGLTYPVYPVPETLPPDMDPVVQYRELMEIGFDGIKMLETKPTQMKILGRKVSDDLFAPFFRAVEADGTHMLWHVADPDFFWDRERIPQVCVDQGWFYGDGTYPTQEEVYRSALTVLERNPRLNVTFAHFFFLAEEPEKLEALFAQYPNVNVDLTPGVEMYGGFGKRPAYFREFFTRYADRIEFGTDGSDESGPEGSLSIAQTVLDFLTTRKEFDVWNYQFRGLELDRETVEQIVHGNFERRCSLKKLNTEALGRYIEKYQHLIREPAMREKILQAAEKL